MIVDGEPKFTGILHDLTARVVLETRLPRAGGADAARRDGGCGGARSEEPADRHSRRGSDHRQPFAGRQQGRGDRPRDRLPIDALNDLMKDLLLFARPPQPHMSPIDHAAAARDGRDLVRRDPGARASRSTWRTRPSP